MITFIIGLILGVVITTAGFTVVLRNLQERMDRVKGGADKIAKQMESLDPRITKIVNDNFEDLLM